MSADLDSVSDPSSDSSKSPTSFVSSNMSHSAVPTATQSRGIAASAYAQQCRELMQLMNRMRSAGVATELDLPRVAVIGNQSAGKSSLVEAISGIKVPRDAGTCTRCPFEVRLRHSSDAWYCRILLRFETDSDGGPLDTIREIPFGDVIRDPVHVEGRLRRAQLAILNPSVAPKDFADATEAVVREAKEGKTVLGSTEQLSFSTNLVCIDIVGPDVTDLAFLDLPGIISNVDEGEDPGNIDLIRNLVTKTITGNCLILLTLSMRDDIENQSAMRLAKEVDPAGSRTIGVLTKADTLQEGEHERWFQVLRNERAKLSNGYYVTKQPGAADLGKNLSFEVAREAEKKFFLSTAPWTSLPAELQRRLGTPKLTVDLSSKLSSYIKTKLPEIRQVVSDTLAGAMTNIERLPPPPSEDPSGELIGLLGTFRYDLDAFVSGDVGSEALIVELKRIFSGFADNIRATRPRFNPFEKTDTRYGKHATSRQWVIVSDLTKSSGVLCNESSKNHRKFVLEMNVADVCAHLASHKTRETPLNTPFPAKATLMVQTTVGWSEITLNAIEAVRIPITETIASLVEKHFGRYVESGLKATVHDVVTEMVDQLVRECQASLEKLLRFESIPFTQNDHYYRASKEKAFVEYSEQRKTGIDLKNPSDDARSYLQKALSNLSYAGMSGLEMEDLAKLLPSDDYAEELDVMAHVFASWKVSYKRLIDNVPRYIDHEIVRRLPSVISHALVTSINYRDKEAAAHLLAEGLDVQAERADLLKRIERISEAKKLLSAFGRV
ncbi:hypothetical protein JCM10212_000653 [Sporobolomyces blumeae]